MGITILYLLIGFNLLNVITQEDTAFYKDIRFWLVLISLGILVVLTVNSI